MSALIEQPKEPYGTQVSSTQKKSVSRTHWLGWTVVVLLCGSTIMPIFLLARAGLHREQCATNLHDISQAMLVYASDYDEALPPMSEYTGGKTPCAGELVKGTQWNKLILPYLHDERLLACPSDPTQPYKKNQTRSYSVATGPQTEKGSCKAPSGVIANGWGETLGNITLPQRTLLVFEQIMDGPDSTVEDAANFYVYMPESWCNTGSQKVLYPRKTYWFSSNYPRYEGAHFGGANVVFCDGHTRWFRYEDTAIGGDPECKTAARRSLFDRRFPL